MAGLIRPGDAGRSRGQVLLVTAFTVAVLLLVLAFVLNGAAVTENVATSGEDRAAGSDALRFRHAAVTAASDLVVAVNRENDTSAAALDDALTEAVTDWDGLAARGEAAQGTGSAVAIDSTTHGSRIAQTNASRNFSAANGTEDWRLARSVRATRAFRANVTRAALASDCVGNCFSVVADNGSATWRVALTKNATAITATVDGPNGTTECNATADAAVIDLSGGTIGGTDCPGLRFAAGLDGPYNVSYVGTNETAGTYELIVDATVTEDGRYADAGDPSVSPAIYAATVSVTYWTPRLTYETDVRVAPGEPDA